jgi:hypothetical protein
MVGFVRGGVCGCVCVGVNRTWCCPYVVGVIVMCHWLSVVSHAPRAPRGPHQGWLLPAGPSPCCVCVVLSLCWLVLGGALRVSKHHMWTCVAMQTPAGGTLLCALHFDLCELVVVLGA